jgi:NADH-quinone oxidoreductase subunit E
VIVDFKSNLSILAPVKDEIEELLTRYPDSRSLVIPMLHLAQAQEGYVSGAGMEEIGTVLGLSPGYIQSVATFYGMYRFKPCGKNIVNMCDNISCALLGADNLVEYVAKKLGIEVGGTTSDMKFTLETVECLGACDRAPVMLINETLYDYLTQEKIDKILEQYK